MYSIFLCLHNIVPLPTPLILIVYDIYVNPQMGEVEFTEATNFSTG